MKTEIIRRTYDVEFTAENGEQWPVLNGSIHPIRATVISVQVVAYEDEHGETVLDVHYPMITGGYFLKKNGEPSARRMGLDYMYTASTGPAADQMRVFMNTAGGMVWNEENT